MPISALVTRDMDIGLAKGSFTMAAMLRMGCVLVLETGSAHELRRKYASNTQNKRKINAISDSFARVEWGYRA